MHILTISSSKSSEPLIFHDFMRLYILIVIWLIDKMEVSYQLRSHFADLIIDLIFKKWPGPVSDLRFLYRTPITTSFIFCRPLLEKFGPDLSILDNFYRKSSSRYSLVHILTTSSSNSSLDPRIYPFCMIDYLITI